MSDSECIVTISVSRRAARALVATFAVMNVLMLAGTAAFAWHYAHREALSPTSQAAGRYLLAQLHLGAENVFAAWYSSSVLLATGLAALGAFAADRKRAGGGRLGGAGGWLLVALVFTGLSLDELGSFHEDVGIWAGIHPATGLLRAWALVLAVPIFAVAVFLVTFAFSRARVSRSFLALMTIGVLLLLTVPLQEGRRSRPILHLMGEEGAEMFGALCLFAAIVMYVFAGSRHSAPAAHLQVSVPLAAATRTSWIVVGVLALVLGVLTLAGFDQPRDAGRPVNWFASTAAILGALGFMQAATIAPSRGLYRWPWVSAALVCLVMAAFYGSSVYGYRSWREVDAVRLALRGFLGIGLFVLTPIIAYHGRSLAARTGVWLWGLLALVSLDGRMAPYVGFCGFAALVLSLPDYLWRREAGSAPGN